MSGGAAVPRILLRQRVDVLTDRPVEPLYTLYPFVLTRVSDIATRPVWHLSRATMSRILNGLIRRDGIGYSFMGTDSNHIEVSENDKQKTTAH